MSSLMPAGPEDAPAVIETWPAVVVDPDPETVSPRTGEPVKVWTVWVVAAASYVAVAFMGAATLWIYWDAVYNFAGASVLMSWWPGEPGSLQRVLLAVAVTAICLTVAVPAAITGYHAWAGYRWARWWAVATAVLSFTALLLRPLAWPAIAAAVVAALLVWLPVSNRYFLAWQDRRRAVTPVRPTIGEVAYGPRRTRS